MARLSRDKGVPIRFVLETHSPTIIERIGQAVENKTMSSDDVQVILFERDREHPKANTSNVRAVTFDEQGVLQEWPFGFLSPAFPPESLNENPSQDKHVD
jgi:predicted ATPase